MIRITSANWAEGKKISDQQGDSKDKYFLYYNADYYYSSEDVKETIFNFANEMANEAGAEIDIQREFASDDVRKNMYADFNMWWSQEAIEDRMGEMLDISTPPPKGFKFFYKEQKYSPEESDSMLVKDLMSQQVFDGVLQVDFGNFSARGDVPLRYDLSAADGFNMLDLVQGFGSSEIPEDLKSFLGNFNFHLRGYSSAYRIKHHGII